MPGVGEVNCYDLYRKQSVKVHKNPLTVNGYIFAYKQSVVSKIENEDVQHCLLDN